MNDDVITKYILILYQIKNKKGVYKMSILDEINLTKEKLKNAYMWFNNTLDFSEIDESIGIINELTTHLNSLYQKAKIDCICS